MLIYSPKPTVIINILVVWYVIKVDVIMWILSKMCTSGCMICLSYFFIYWQFFYHGDHQRTIYRDQKKKIPLMEACMVQLMQRSKPSKSKIKSEKGTKCKVDLILYHRRKLSLGNFKMWEQVKVPSRFFKSGLSIPFTNSSRNSSPSFLFFFFFF